MGPEIKAKETFFQRWGDYLGEERILKAGRKALGTRLRFRMQMHRGGCAGGDEEGMLSLQ